MANSPIDLTISEIAKHYQSRTLPWMKAKRPEEWGEMLTLEGEINKTALRGDLGCVREALNSYQGVILAMVKELGG